MAQHLRAFSKNDSVDRVLSITSNKVHKVNHQFSELVKDTLNIVQVRTEYIKLHLDLFPQAERSLFKSICDQYHKDEDQWKYSTASTSDMNELSCADKKFFQTLTELFIVTTHMLAYLKQLKAVETV